MRLLAILLLSLSTLGTSVCAKEFSQSRMTVMVFTQLSKAEYVLDATKSDYPNADIEVFFVDQKQNLEDAMSDSLPAKKLQAMSEEQQVAYLRKTMMPIAEKKAYKMIHSAAGVSLMKAFKIDTVPAILFDYEFVTLGMPLSESISLYKRALAK